MKVLITVPNLGWLHKEVVYKLLMLQKDNRYELEFYLPQNKPIENNYHNILTKFINEKFDFWLSIDADNPPIKNPLDLVELDLDIVGLPTPIWYNTFKKGERPVYLNGFEKAENGQYAEYKKMEGLQEVDAIGTGCFVAARRIFENDFIRKEGFHKTWKTDGTMKKGGDLMFCDRLKKEGFKIWMHYGYFCDHYVEVSLNEVMDSINNIII